MSADREREQAEALASEYFSHSTHGWHTLADKIDAAIRAARNAALETAAVTGAGIAQVKSASIDIGDAVAAAIRALKDAGP